ncbi:sigma-70 family RNA polymerase sigma factor [Draconibacterium sp. IB214405]|uniref:RNA polymerase sigma factor n=1 Tax=Draconibacterium sp. IB214405 TaxID=3097352 RepID=UPI002A0DFDC7|nr:sigma-70 family RNA polymerase sigma factor [Draconibacterium sp. IB214405]MDX8339997.1 sigma-70 family RNA polymerase sigma factor [Draconibacterium sp. IB214405]
MTDSQLIEQIRENNDLAFRALINKYKNLVYNTAFRLVRNSEDAEDIFQDVFLEIYKSCDAVRFEEDLTMWIYKIAYNKSISFLRRKNPAKVSKNDDDIADNQLNDNLIEKNNPAKQLEQKENISTLYQLIDQLPENQKKILLLHKFEGLSQKEICEQLGMSEHSVESLIYRARKNLKLKLIAYFKLNS